MGEGTRKFIPIQHFIGLQVIDTKGSLIGNVKDLSLDFRNRDTSLKVTSKNKGEMDFTWEDVQSVEDVVLLKKQVDISSPSESQRDLAVEQSPQAVLICPNCGAASPVRAKFCSKCGADLKT